MMLARRVQRSPSHMAYPSELAPCVSSPDLLASPPTTPPRSSKHSLSKPMSWLNRSSTSTSSPSIPHAPKPTRISEPKVGSSLDHFTPQRSGPLGSGATIVRTPQEALFGSTCTFQQISEKQGMEDDILLQDHAEESEDRFLPSLTHSPPLPPLPPLPDIPNAAESREEGGSVESASPANIPLSDHALHSRSPDHKSHRSSSQPSVQAHPCATSRPIPAIPTETDTVPPQPPFDAILISPIPDGSIDPSKLIVVLETCTTTYRATLRTLVSRPSHLSRYLTSLLSPVSETASIYSNTSNASLAQHTNGLSSVIRDNLASPGRLTQFSNAIHIFLDRPSAPYVHVLAYLRSLPNTPEQPETLPRLAQLASQTPSRLESLLELCDEASYLGLEALYDLCRHDISRTHRTPFSTYLGSNTLRGKTGSVRSFRTVIEQCQPHQDVRPLELRASKCSTAVRSATRESSPGSSCENRDLLTVGERSRERNHLKYEVGSPPQGWI